MSAISASAVRELRERTGAGMMDCKQALVESQGDMDRSIDWLRKKGLSKAAKKGDRITAEGLSASLTSQGVGVVVELNSETDFVARNSLFQSLCSDIAALALSEKITSLDILNNAKLPSGVVVSEAVALATATIGEKISLRRLVCLNVNPGVVASYVHNSVAEGLGKISVIVSLKSESDRNEELTSFGKQIAMHIAALNPLALNRNMLSSDLIEKEKSITYEKHKDKPEQVISKIIDSAISAYFKEVCLLEQVSVHNSSKTVDQLLKDLSLQIGKEVEIVDFVRVVVGEGIEKDETNFADEVASIIR